MNKQLIFLKDPTVWSLISVNLFVIISTLIDKLTLEQVLYIYFFQNIIIGFITILKIINYSGDIEKDDKANFPNKTFATLFFIFHFGLFHFVYLEFLDIPSMKIFLSISPYLVTFLINHLFSYYFYSKEKESIGTIFFAPYNRIIPMHLFLVLGFILMLIFQIFCEYVFGIEQSVCLHLGDIFGILTIMVLKTIIDVYSHVQQHYKNKYK